MIKVLTTPNFDKGLKKLSKKYASILTDLAQLVKTLKEEPTTGESLGKSCYKIRMAISSKQKGKSGGARVITYVKIVQETVYMVAIYDKSDKESVSNDEIESFINEILDKLN